MHSIADYCATGKLNYTVHKETENKYFTCYAVVQSVILHCKNA